MNEDRRSSPAPRPQPERRPGGPGPRRRGARDGRARPRTRPATREALLRVGRELFARHGYDGASVREITRRAGANLGAVSYHFGSKQALFDAVIGTIITPLRERVLAAAAAPGVPLDRIEQVLRAVFDYVAEAPDTPRFIVHVLATGRRAPPAVVAWVRDATGALSKVVEEGQREGSIRPGEPLLMAISVFSQPFHLSLVRVRLREALALDQDDAATRARIVGHAARFVRRALADGNETLPAHRSASRNRSAGATERKEGGA